MGQRHGLDHQLQGADAVALRGVDQLAAAAIVAAIELAGHDEAVVTECSCTSCGRAMSSRQLLCVDLDHLFAEGVDLVDAIEALQAIQRRFRSPRNLPGIVVAGPRPACEKPS